MTDDPRRSDQPATGEELDEHVEDLEVPAEQEGDVAGGMPCARTGGTCAPTNCGEVTGVA